MGKKKNQCLHCGGLVYNKYCNVGCQNKHLNPIRAQKQKEKSYIKELERLNKRRTCKKCTNEFCIKDSDIQTGSGDFCSSYCSHSYSATINKDKKIRTRKNRIKQNFFYKRKIGTSCKVFFFVCENEKCKKICTTKNEKQKFCCNTCVTQSERVRKKLSEVGKKSATNRVKRSKNEILFYELCEKHFANVEHNKPIFNGWDADIIIHDIKVAVLWNGPWHYRPIANHKLKQVQNRDKIKLKEIEKFGYRSYVIKDDGKHKKDFVKEKFNIFLQFVNESLISRNGEVVVSPGS